MSRLRIPHAARPLLAALALAGLALGAVACGYDEHPTAVVEGEPVELGELSYNVIFSRVLNPNDNQDSAYLVGKPEPPPGTSYFGIFLEVQNESDEPQRLARSFRIVDTNHNAYRAIPSDSLFALRPGATVEPEEQVPELDTAAQQGPIKGSMVLFRLPAQALEDRPLILIVPGPGGPGEVTLDL